MVEELFSKLATAFRRSAFAVAAVLVSLALGATGVRADPPTIPLQPLSSPPPLDVVTIPPGTPPVPRAFGSSAGAETVGAASSLPAAVGRTAGSFSVTAAGAANYTIPIQTPPALGALELKLALVYNSRGPNGLLGMGWSISGLSVISRCNRTHAQDGAPGPVTLTMTDRLCLDGQQLKLTSGTAPNYVYAGNTFATEIETFALISAIGSGSSVTSFKVTTKNGLIYTYGGTADSEIIAGNSGVIRAWALSKISDRDGNTISLAYQNDTEGGDPSNGSYRISQITYPTTSTGLGPYYKVVFSYANRPSVDVPSSYIAGHPVLETQQLNSITTEDYSSTTPIKQYNLTYTQSSTTNRNTLTTVQECSASTCLAPTMVSYQAGTSGWSTSAYTFASATATDFSGPWFGDFDGDGRTDILYGACASSCGTGTDLYELYVLFGGASGYGPAVDTGIKYVYGGPSSAGPSGGLMVGRLRGNGKDQILYPSGSSWYVLDYGLGSAGFQTSNTGVPVNYEFILMDVDGDGLADLVSWPNTQIMVRRNTTSGGAVQFAATAQVVYTTSKPAPWGTAFFNPPSIVQTADFNGDGRADLLILDPSTANWLPLLSNGANASGAVLPFTAEPEFYASLLSARPTFLDWNGDGCTDISAGSQLLISDCAGGFTAYTLPSGVGSVLIKPPTAWQLPIPVDWNGDGRQDLLYAVSGDSNWHVLQSNGRDPATASQIRTNIPWQSNYGWANADVFGDGRLALAGSYWGQGLNLNLAWYASNGAGTPPDLATSFTDGFGMNQSPSYVPLTNPSYYVKYKTAVFPEEDYQGPLYAVKSFTASDGAGSTYQNVFNYQGARTNVQGRGFEGFGLQQIYDSRNGVYTIKTYGQTFPYMGMVLANETELPDAQLTFSLNTLQSTTLPASGGGYETRFVPTVASNSAAMYEVTGTDSTSKLTNESTQYTYDAYANPTSVTKSVTDIDSLTPPSPFYGEIWTTTVASTFENDTTDWCYGLPLTRSITNSVPGQTTQARTWSYSVDGPHCRTTQRVTEPGVSGLSVTTAYNFGTTSGCPGALLSETVTGSNPNGSAMTPRGTTYGYGTRCQLAEQTTNALGQSTTRTFSYEFGVPLTSKDPNADTTTWTLDDYGRLAKETRPDGTYSVLSRGTVSSSSTPSLRFWVNENVYAGDGTFISEIQRFYDGFNRQSYDESYRVLGVWTTNWIELYDSVGRRLALYQPFSAGHNGYTQWTYNVLNEPTMKQLYNSSGALDRSTTYSNLGRTTVVTDPLGNVTQHVTDVGWS